MTDHDKPRPGRLIEFDIPHVPGFIPEGCEPVGTFVAPTEVRGFIPAEEPVNENEGAAPVTAASEGLLGEKPGVCPYCGKDFSAKPDPAKSLKGHMLAKHK